MSWLLLLLLSFAPTPSQARLGGEASSARSAAATEHAWHRVMIPDGQGCNVISDRRDCCFFKDGRHSPDYSGQDCVPTKAEKFFDVGVPSEVVCQPRCWADGSCGGGADQSAVVGECPAALPAKRLPVPGARGCNVVVQRDDCCRFVDGRSAAEYDEYSGQECVPTKDNVGFDVGAPVEVVCQPRCWAEGTCGWNAGDQSDRIRSCPAALAPAPAPPARHPTPPEGIIDRGDALIPAGGDFRFYVVGSSNAAWQTWVDQLHVMLLGLGYNVKSHKAHLPGEITKPERQQICDDVSTFRTLDTPRIGLPGWSSWGFSADSKADCDASGFRTILGVPVSCTNGWTCIKWPGDRADIVPKTALAKGVSDADVVIMSTWINDAKETLAARQRCFNGTDVGFFDSLALTAASLKATIAAIRSENPKVKILVLARYPDTMDVVRVNERSLEEVNALNEDLKQRLAGEENTYWVDLHFPLKTNVFQVQNTNHPNCRGDKFMATNIVESLFEHKLLSRGLKLGETEVCLANEACQSLSIPCCQRSVFCRVTAEGTCGDYGPGRKH